MVGKHTKKFFHMQITEQILLDLFDLSSVQSRPTRKEQTESVVLVIVALDLETDTVVLE